MIIIIAICRFIGCHDTVRTCTRMPFNIH